MPGSSPPAEEGSFAFRSVQAHYKSKRPAARKNAPIVLLLHGAKFTSQTWLDLGTLRFLQGKGYHALAVDLPGFGKTPSLQQLDPHSRALFIKEALEFAGSPGVSAAGAVVVSPSMSGIWAMPFLNEYGHMLKGWVAVAPSGVVKATPSEAARKVPLLALYGENDAMTAQADNLMRMFDQVQKVIFPAAGHACYMDQPDLFHKALTAFLDKCLSTSRDL